MKIAITGGKGGTGKSTVATGLAFALAKEKRVMLIDADVDCPGDHLLLGIELEKISDVENMIPVFDFNKCMKCGKCAVACPENAIVFTKGKHPIFIPDQCIGCRACKLVCPYGAISESKQIIGEISEGKKDNLTLLSGKMKTGIEESSLIVNALKKIADKKSQEEKFDYIIIDTAAGTHCPVIAALLGNELVLAVTEPTPLGAHDLNLILDLNRQMKMKNKVILNRSTIGNKELIFQTVKNANAEIIAEIPYSKNIEKKYFSGIAIENKEINNIAKWIKNQK